MMWIGLIVLAVEAIAHGKPNCPDCGRPGHRAIYAGLPMRLCPSRDCADGIARVWGVGEWAIRNRLVAYEGGVFLYKGPYILGLLMRLVIPRP